MGAQSMVSVSTQWIGSSARATLQWLGLGSLQSNQSRRLLWLSRVRIEEHRQERQCCAQHAEVAREPGWLYTHVPSTESAQSILRGRSMVCIAAALVDASELLKGRCVNKCDVPRFMPEVVEATTNKPELANRRRIGIID